MGWLITKVDFFAKIADTGHLAKLFGVVLLIALIGVKANTLPIVEGSPTSHTGKNLTEISGSPTLGSRAQYNLLETTVSLIPDADAFVRAGVHSNEYYGSDSRLTVKAASPDYTREAFVRFDLLPVQGLVTSAAFVLQPRSVGNASNFVNEAAIAANTGWDENVIDWNSKPDSGAVIGSWSPSQGEAVVLDVTSQAQAAMAWDRKLSLRIYSPADVGSQGWAHYHSKETDPTRAPTLLLTVLHESETSDVQRVLSAEADAFVRGGDFSNENYSDESRLTVKAGQAGYSREAYLKFNMSDATGTVSNAKLVLYPVGVGSAQGMTNEAALVPDGNWDEEGPTWNTKPDSGAIIHSWTPVQDEPVEIDVTSHVQSSMAWNSEISFRIYSPNEVGGQGWAHYSSSESSGANLPKLVITVSAPKESVGKDAFGIDMLFPTEPGTALWNSSSWDNGIPREITPDGDQYDPSNWSGKRGNGTLSVNGDGILSMAGSEPRLYLDGTPEKFWKNIEATVYFKRIRDDNVPWAGLVIGARGSTNGHNAENACDATTYHARFRNDGKMDFEKELEHPHSTSAETQLIWDGSTLPYDQWIGMKFVVRNVNNGQHVLLEVYRDMTGGANGGEWEKLGEYLDSGQWEAPHNCEYASNRVITEGGGVVFIRNSGVQEAEYKWMSVREIKTP